jgi:hypothetical protein
MLAPGATARSSTAGVRPIPGVHRLVGKRRRARGSQEWQAANRLVTPEPGGSGAMGPSRTEGYPVRPGHG